jgi:hypothetical protein
MTPFCTVDLGGPALRQSDPGTGPIALVSARAARTKPRDLRTARAELKRAVEAVLAEGYVGVWDFKPKLE